MGHVASLDLARPLQSEATEECLPLNRSLKGAFLSSLCDRREAGGGGQGQATKLAMQAGQDAGGDLIATAGGSWGCLRRVQRRYHHAGARWDAAEEQRLLRHHSAHAEGGGAGAAMQLHRAGGPHREWRRGHSGAAGLPAARLAGEVHRACRAAINYFPWLLQGPGKRWEHYELTANHKPVRIPMHVKAGDTVKVRTW